MVKGVVGKSMTPMGFEPTPMKTTALTLRLRPLGHSVITHLLTTQDTATYNIHTHNHNHNHTHMHHHIHTSINTHLFNFKLHTHNYATIHSTITTSNQQTQITTLIHNTHCTPTTPQHKTPICIYMPQHLPHQAHTGNFNYKYNEQIRNRYNCLHSRNLPPISFSFQYSNNSNSTL
jgi:hypothetical protein